MVHAWPMGVACFLRMLISKTHGLNSFFRVRCGQDGCRQEQAIDKGQERGQEEDVSGCVCVINSLVMF